MRNREFTRHGYLWVPTRRDLLKATGGAVAAGLLTPRIARAAFAPVVSTAKGSVGGTGVTTSAMDTTGSTLLVAAFMNYASVTGGAVSDSVGGQSNTWTLLTTQVSSTLRLRLFYCIGPTHAGSGHTFTGASDFGPDYCDIAVMAFSAVSPAFDLQSGNFSNSANSIQPGTITPRWTAELLVTATAGSISGTTAGVNSGFGAPIGVAPDGSHHFGLYMSSLIQTAIIPENPTWTWTGALTTPCAVAAAFKYSGSAAPSGQIHHRVTGGY